MTPASPALSLCLSAALAVVAPASAMDPEAKESFERGLAEYADKSYASAVRDFRLAFALDPRPEILFAWAQAERMYGRCSQATKLYQRFLASKPSEQQADAARQGLLRCKDQPDTTPVEPGDEAPEEQAPEPEAPAPAPAAPPPEPPPPPPKPRVDGLGLGLAVGGAALAITGGALLGVGERSAKVRGPDAGSYDDFAATADQVRALRISGGVLTGIGGALLIAGVVRLIVRARPARRDMSFWTSPQGAGVAVRLRF